MTDPIPAVFVGRPNRFVVEARLVTGEVVSAHLANTGRLTHLTEPGRPLLLRVADSSSRATRFTVVRWWDGCWVGLEAARTASLLEQWLVAGNPLPGFGLVESVEREVTVGRHRLDLRLGTGSGPPIWVEVKSGGRARGEAALLSATPSVRGTAHLEALAGLVRSGDRAAVAFVFQRGDVAALHVGGEADAGWIDAVRAARAAGVAVLALACRVTPTEVAIRGPIPVRDVPV